MNKEIKQELDTLKQAIAAAEAKYKEIQAMPMSEEDMKKKMEDKEKMMMEMANEMQYMNRRFDYMSQMVSSLSNYVSSLEGAIYEHATLGHIPQIVGAEKMNKALEVLGLAGDYQAIKKYAYASKTDKKTLLFTLESK